MLPSRFCRNHVFGTSIKSRNWDAWNPSPNTLSSCLSSYSMIKHSSLLCVHGNPYFDLSFGESDLLYFQEVFTLFGSKLATFLEGAPDLFNLPLYNYKVTYNDCLSKPHIRQKCGVLATQRAWAEVTYKLTSRQTDKQTDYPRAAHMCRGLIIILYACACYSYVYIL